MSCQTGRIDSWDRLPRHGLTAGYRSVYTPNRPLDSLVCGGRGGLYSLSYSYFSYTAAPKNFFLRSRPCTQNPQNPNFPRIHAENRGKPGLYAEYAECFGRRESSDRPRSLLSARSWRDRRRGAVVQIKNRPQNPQKDSPRIHAENWAISRYAQCTRNWRRGKEGCL